MHAFWKLGGNCTASVWFSYMAHVIIKFKVQKYFSMLWGKSWKSDMLWKNEDLWKGSSRWIEQI